MFIQANTIQQQETAAQGLPKVAVLGKFCFAAVAYVVLIEIFWPSVSLDLPTVQISLSFVAGAAGGIGQPLSMLLKM